MNETKIKKLLSLINRADVVSDRNEQRTFNRVNCLLENVSTNPNHTVLFLGDDNTTFSFTAQSVNDAIIKDGGVVLVSDGGYKVHIELFYLVQTQVTDFDLSD